MQNIARVSRERTTEIRWIGDAQTEVAALAVLNYPNLMEVEPGILERWMRAPISKADAMREAIEREGGRFLS
jgi:hypothetical protein